MSTNFTLTNQNITMVKGDTLSFNIKAFDQNNELITFDDALFTCKKNATEEATVFKLSLGDGISFDTDHYTVRVPSQDTLYEEAGRYYYDMKVSVGDDVFTILRGVLDLEQNVSEEV